MILCIEAHPTQFAKDPSIGQRFGSARIYLDPWCSSGLAANLGTNIEMTEGLVDLKQHYK
jgi:hypothetical protein